MPQRLLSFLLLLAAAFATRAPMFGNPVIYTDEEFYLLVGTRILHGAWPYLDLWDRKPAGLFLLYAGMVRLGGLLGLSPVLAYQLIGTLFVLATALLIRRMARYAAGPFGATAAGLAYILWLNLGHAGAGQSPIFYNLPMALAGLITLRARLGRLAPFRSLAEAGAAAMLLAGLAMQIKYSAVFEGVFFGCVLLWLAVRAGGWKAALPRGLLWIGIALAPTLAAFLAYAVAGRAQAFLFANFLSIFARSADAGPGLLLLRLALILAVLAPLLLCAAWPRRRLSAEGFLLGWLGAALAGLLLFGTYLHHYLLPVLVPATAAAAGLLGARRFRPVALALLALGFLVSEGMMIASLRHHGTAAQFAAIARAIDPAGCLYVYSGDPAFYGATPACIPTRFAFPSHLSRRVEAHSLGADQTAEVLRILATRPTTVILAQPCRTNWPARQQLLAAMARDYRLVLTAPLGRDPISVYRLQ